MRLGERDQTGDAARIVDGAVADVVAGGIGVAAAEMVPVRGVDDIFAGPRPSGQDADDVARSRRRIWLVSEIDARLRSGTARKPGCRLLAQGSQVEARIGEQPGRRVERQPADHPRLVHMVAGVVHIVLGARPGGLDDVPAVGSRRGVVDDEGGGGALPRRFLIFVGPAAVIGHRPAVERPLQALGLPIGIVDEDDHRLAAHVDTGIVVPARSGALMP